MMFTNGALMRHVAFAMLFLRASSTAVSPVRAAASSTAPSYPMPLPCTGEGCTTITYSLQDFNVIQHENGTYFRFSKAANRGQGLELATAPTLAGPWERQQPVLGPGTALNDPQASTPAEYAQAHLMTPEVHLINGVYYLYFTIGYHGQDLAVASSPDMSDGSWVSHGSVGVPRSPGTAYQRIDCDLLTTVTNGSNVPPANRLQLAFGDQHAAIYGANMTNATHIDTSMAPIPLIRDQKELTGANKTGGAFHFVNGKYTYFLYDVGSCCAKNATQAYSTYVCRATDPSGPYFDRNGLNCAGEENGSGTLLLTSHSPDAAGNYQVLAPGSVGVIRSPNDGLILTYQYHDQTKPEVVPITLYYGHNYLGFDDEDWPFVASSPQV